MHVPTGFRHARPQLTQTGLDQTQDPERTLTCSWPEGWPTPRSLKRAPGRWMGTRSELLGLLEEQLQRGSDLLVIRHTGGGKGGRAPTRWFAPGVPMRYLGAATVGSLYEVPVELALRAVLNQDVEFTRREKTPAEEGEQA